ncbi:MAG: FHA domain-containing protein [Gammaproteobacteria bacterium]
MEILEELTKQAQLLKVKRGVDESWNKNDEANQGGATKSLFEIHDYLRKIVNRLNQVRPEVKVVYTVFDKYQINESFQSDYELSLSSKRQVETLELSLWMHSNENKFVFKRNDFEGFEGKLKELFSYGLVAGDNQPDINRDLSSVDEIEILTDIPVSFIFTAAEYSNTINVVVTNFESLGETVFRLDSESITHKFLDHFAKYLIRKKSSFFPDENDSLKSISKRISINDESQELPETENNITKNISVNSKLSPFKKNAKIFLTYHENLNELNSKIESFSIGRDNSSGLTILSEFVSRHHASIIFRKGKFVIVDKSTNGTFIKPQGGKEVYIQQEDYPISGCGLICLGKSISPSNEHLIYFFCE